MNRRTLVQLLQSLPIGDEEPVYLSVDSNKPKISTFTPLMVVDHDPEVGVILISAEESDDETPKSLNDEEQQILARIQSAAAEYLREVRETAGCGPENNRAGVEIPAGGFSAFGS